MSSGRPAARSTVAISSWRSARGPGGPGRSPSATTPGLAGHARQTSSSTGFGEASRPSWEEPGPPASPTRRPGPHAGTQVLGPAIEPLTYDEPIHLASADGVWMTDVDGVTVPRRLQQRPLRRPRASPGHRGDRPAVPGPEHQHALPARLRHRAGRAAGRRPATPALDTVLFVNSGSEANDLAWRLAVQLTGNAGGLCTDFAYHGISEAIAASRPRSWGAGRHSRPRRDAGIPPDTYRGHHLDSAEFAAALDRTGGRAGSRPRPPSSTGSCTSDGFYDLDPDLRPATGRGMTHEAGRPLDRRRGAGRPRSHRRGDVVLPAASASCPTS